MSLMASSVVPAFAGTRITGPYSTKRVTQVCSLQTTLTHDRPDIPAKKGDVNYCSGTIVSPTQILTAAHCAIEPKQTMVVCSCGESDHQKRVIYQVDVASKLHPDYQAQSSDFQDPANKADVQLVTVTTKTQNDCTGAGVQPMPIVKDPAESKKLLASGKCYLAGFGVDNNGQSNLHSASTPRGMQFDDFTPKNSKMGSDRSRISYVTFYNGAYRSRLNDLQNAELSALENSGASAEEVEALHAKQIDIFMRMQNSLTGDPNRNVAMRSGDSGGAVFCTDTTGVDRLVAVIHSSWQMAALTSGPSIQAWLEQNLNH